MFSGQIRLETGVYYSNGRERPIDYSDIIAGYGAADAYTLYYWFFTEIVVHRLENLQDIYVSLNFSDKSNHMLLKLVVDSPATAKHISLKLTSKKMDGGHLDWHLQYLIC